MAISLSLKWSNCPTFPDNIFSRRSAESRYPARYSIKAPKTAPMVDATITPRMCNSLFKVKKPAKVKITSDGIGGKIFSRAISSAIAK